MRDPYLEAMMHGELLSQNKLAGTPLPPKDKFDLATERYIDLYIDSLDIEEEMGQNKIELPAQKKARIREETLAAMNTPELDAHLSASFQYLISNGAQYLDFEIYQAMQDQFTKIKERLKKIDPIKEPIPNNLQTFFGLEDPVILGISKVAVEKFYEEEYAICLSLFTLLTVLNSENFDYWYRKGIAAQMCGDYKLAEKAYKKALILNPELFGARLFLIECYLDQGQIEEAKKALEEAKIISKSIDLEEIWTSFLEKLNQASLN